MCPAGIFSVPLKTSFAYQVGPGIIRTLGSAPPYFWANAGVKMFSGGVVLFLISGSSRLAMRVQCESAELMRTLPFFCTWLSGHLSAHRYVQALYESPVFPMM